MVGRKILFFKSTRKELIYITTIDPNLPYENYGENIVGKSNLRTRKIMDRKRVPLQLWCYSLTLFRNKGRTGYDIIFGNKPETSKYMEFDFYDYCW